MVAVSATSVPLHPIVLLHGYYGCRLLYTVDRSVPGSPNACPPKTLNSTLWLSIFNFADPVSNLCFLDSAKLHYDVFSRRSYSAPGVTVTTTPFGETDGAEWLSPPPLRIKDNSYFKYMVDGLVSLGYQRNVNIKAAQYDWRRAPNENTEWIINLRKLIEEMYAENGGMPVILLTHSMASTFSYVFLNSMPVWWRGKYIRSWLLISSVFGGVFKYQYAYYGIDDYPANLFPASRLAIRTYSTTTFLLPRVASFGDEVLIRASDGEYRAEDYARFFYQLGYPNAYEQWKDTRVLYDPNVLIPPGNFSIYCINGLGLQTVERTVFDGPLSRNTSFTPVYGDGDTFVNAKSLRLCYRFGIGKRNFAAKEFASMDHLEMIRNPGPINYVVSTVNYINYNMERFVSEYV